jgi:hypothetical protein
MQKVIQHLMDLLTNHLSSEVEQELLGLIEDYRQGLLPLIVPLTLLKHHLNRYPVPEWVHQVASILFWPIRGPKNGANPTRGKSIVVLVHLTTCHKWVINREPTHAIGRPCRQFDTIQFEGGKRC